MLRALDFARGTGNRLDLAKYLIELAQIQIKRGDLRATRQALREAAIVAGEMHAESLLLDVVAGMADLAVAAGKQPQATRLYRFVRTHKAASEETARHVTQRLSAAAALPSDAPGSLDAALVLGFELAEASEQ
jgi:hypothetical protein